MAQGDGSNGLVVELIEAGVLAGAYSGLERVHPEAARGLERMRQKWSGRVAALCSEICADAGRKAQASAIMPKPLGR